MGYCVRCDNIGVHVGLCADTMTSVLCPKCMLEYDEWIIEQSQWNEYRLLKASYEDMRWRIMGRSDLGLASAEAVKETRESVIEASNTLVRTIISWLKVPKKQEGVCDGAEDTA